MALEIIVSLNGRPIAAACAVNISDLAKLSDYKVTAFETASSFTPAASNTFKIEAHDREQSCWALVEKIASRAKVHPEEQGLSRDEALAQGKRCGCRGADDYCECQNVPDAITRADRRATRPVLAGQDEGSSE
ncbi:hypothetical protein [Rhodopseudomonas palustris]|uniref:hypothetical protein n=1 Tax=Rhodopseudomonas palustris TaxID=1076 RepID=UPI000D4FAF32|nr:hypothetical protein [Rhodopseudomonas palustris]PPQ42114.1 hypothetical protein CKO39_18160 [Rhodopseudomonas palustris]